MSSKSIPVKKVRVSERFSSLRKLLVVWSCHVSVIIKYTMRWRRWPTYTIFWGDCWLLCCVNNLLCWPPGELFIRMKRLLSLHDISYRHYSSLFHWLHIDSLSHRLHTKLSGLDRIVTRSFGPLSRSACRDDVTQLRALMSNIVDIMLLCDVPFSSHIQQ